MKKHFFKLFLLFALCVAIASLFEPTRAYFFERTELKNELQAKNVTKDSLADVLQSIRNNPRDLERNARNSGFAKRGETMLKIVRVDVEDEVRKLKISAVLLLSLIIVVVLILVFAIPKKTNPAKKADNDLSQELIDATDTVS